MSTEKDIFESLEIELADLKNVEGDEDDDDESGSGQLFTISSFGVDHTVESLVGKLNKEQYYIPNFQRKYVWSQNDASRFIESLLLGLPVPGIFLYKEHDSQKHLVIDGQQRLKSLQKYYDGTFGEKKFRLSGLKSQWNGRAYIELDEDDRLRLDDAVVHATIFKQDTPTENMDSVYEVFERINTGGMKLSPQEIRTCVAHGNFNDLLFKLNEDARWRSIFGVKSIRLKDIELILRFFAFHSSLANYSKPMRNFLTNYMNSRKNVNEAEAKVFSVTWDALLQHLSSTLPARPFRPGGRALNAAFWDSFSVAAAHALSANPTLDQETTLNAYMKLEQDGEYITLISGSTSDDENVKKRFQKAHEAFGNASST